MTIRPWSFLLLLILMLALFGGAVYAQTSTPFAMTGTLTLNYEDGSSASCDIVIAGIETINQQNNGSIKGTISVAGQVAAIEDDTARRTVYEARYYHTDVEIDGRRVSVSILLGHPQDPTFGNIGVTDARTSGNIGYGRGPIT